MPPQTERCVCPLPSKPWMTPSNAYKGKQGRARHPLLRHLELAVAAVAVDYDSDTLQRTHVNGTDTSLQDKSCGQSKVSIMTCTTYKPSPSDHMAVHGNRSRAMVKRKV